MYQPPVRKSYSTFIILIIELRIVVASALFKNMPSRLAAYDKAKDLFFAFIVKNFSKDIAFRNLS